MSNVVSRRTAPALTGENVKGGHHLNLFSECGKRWDAETKSKDCIQTANYELKNEVFI